MFPRQARKRRCSCGRIGCLTEPQSWLRSELRPCNHVLGNGGDIRLHPRSDGCCSCSVFSGITGAGASLQAAQGPARLAVVTASGRLSDRQRNGLDSATDVVVFADAWCRMARPQNGGLLVASFGILIFRLRYRCGPVRRLSEPPRLLPGCARRCGNRDRVGLRAHLE